MSPTEYTRCGSGHRIELIKSALGQIVAIHDDITLRIARIVFCNFRNKHGLSILKNWFSKAGIYDDGAVFRLWDCFVDAQHPAADRGTRRALFPLCWLTDEFIFSEARKHGWSPGGNATQPEAVHIQKKRLQQRAERAEHLRRSRNGWLQTEIKSALANEPLTSHPALSWAQLTSQGVELMHLGRKGDNDLIVPVGNGGCWIGGLSISPLGDTQWLPHSVLRDEVYWHPIGTPDPRGRILICDDLKDGIALHKSIGDAVAVAFNAKNIGLVAKSLRLNFPDTELTICAHRKIRGTDSKYFAQIEDASARADAFVAYPWNGSGSEDSRTFFDVYTRYGSHGIGENIDLAEHGWPQATDHDCEVRHG